MFFPTLMDTLPLWGLFLVILGAILAAAEIGYRVGFSRRQELDPEKEGPTGAIVAATLGLLAFTLAFTFGLAASRFDNRRETFQDEVNAIGTTYLRADFLPAEQAEKSRVQLREYVDVRLELYEPDANLDEIVRRSEKLHDQLWAEAVVAAKAIPNSEMVALYIESLNELIDLHAKRVTAGLRSRIPASIWVTLFLVSAISMTGMGYQAGLAGTTRPIAALGLIVSFAVILLLITDLDRPQEGLLRVNHQGMVELRAKIAPSAESSEKMP